MALHETLPHVLNELPSESGPCIALGRTEVQQACASRYSLGKEVVRSVPVYTRHVFLAFKKPREWPSGKLGSVEAERLPRLLAATIREAAHRLAGRVQLTVCEADEASDGDVIVFPDMKRFRALTVHDLALLVDEVLVSGRERHLSSEPLHGVQLFVCCDPSRGGRCAQAGVPLLAALQAGVQRRGWTEQVTVRACSHAGCKCEAARVLVFSSRGDCSVGHWYGGVGLADVAALLDEHIGAGRIVEHLWRGQMAPPQGHPRPQPARFPGAPPSAQLQSSAGVGELKKAEMLSGGGEGQQRAASPGGSDGEVDESVLGYSMTASESSEEGLFSPGGGGDASAGKQGGGCVGASFGSRQSSLESTGDAVLREVARSEGGSKGEGITIQREEVQIVMGFFAKCTY